MTTTELGAAGATAPAAPIGTDDPGPLPAPGTPSIRRSVRLTLAIAIIRRIIGMIVVLWAAVTAAFLAIYATPGNTADLILGTSQKSPEAEAAVTAQWHLNRSVLTQYLHYVAGVLHGDFGTSYQLNAPVSRVIFSQLGSTVELAVGGALVAIVLALLLSITTAGRPWPSKIANAIELIVVSLPEFWLAILLVFGVSFHLGWFPVAGAYGFSSLVLPSLALGLGIFGMLSQLLRGGIERSLDEPYSLSVRARGVSNLQLRLRHSLRHAALPVVQLTGYVVGGLLGGAVIVEQVFSRPGIGQITLSAVGSKDLPVVLGVALLGAFAYVAVNTIVDVLALVIDPRLRFTTKRS